MTCVAWDGKTIAADKRAVTGDTPVTVTKLRRHQDKILACTGDFSSGLMLIRWYELGHDPAFWPACQREKDTWARLIVASGEGVWIYEREPVAFFVEEPFMAWGSGKDAALGALHCGKTAKEAVEIAALVDLSCGNGVDVEILRKAELTAIRNT